MNGEIEMEKVFSEWFWSQRSAERAADRMRAKGYSARVRFALAADGRSDWLLEVFT